MAAPYALPPSSLQHACSQHLPAPSKPHAHSHSAHSLSAWRTPMLRESLSTLANVDEAQDHEDRLLPERRRSHSHNRASSQTSDGSATTLSREKPPPAALDTLEGWTKERTAGGKHIITPGPDVLSAPYSPPKQHASPKPSHHKHRHHDQHHHRQHHHHHHHHHHHKHEHEHCHAHGGDEDKAKRSSFTRFLLPYAARYPILHAILVDKDSRRIFYFMTLNFCFMTVQAFYGYVTDSLGLLSDSIHMFFDCVALLVGLLAAVMSKWPPSQRFPYGFGKIETLSGFANGVLLMLLSVEIAFEALERLWEGTKTKRLSELLVVSSLGLAVNLVGMVAFGHHHHHGHDHGHSPGHGDHEHGEGAADTPHSHAPDQLLSPAHSESHTPSKQHAFGHHAGHGHRHAQDNENMHGIYLHVLADTLGSVSVILSTVLTSMWGWAGWDPLASCLIAVLIFLSSKPLVISSAKRLLLSVPEDSEYNLRNAFGGILQQRGVVSYAAPKFWLDDRTGSAGGSKLVGVVHITVARGASLEDARDRVHGYLLREGIDVVVQAEREGDGACWCARAPGAATPRTPKPL